MKDSSQRSVKFVIPFSRLTIISTINSGSIHFSAVLLPLCARRYVALKIVVKPELSANYVALKINVVFPLSTMIICNRIVNAILFFIDGATKISWELVKRCSWSVPGLIEIWKCWFLCRVENQKTSEKNPRTLRKRINNKLNPQMVSTLGIEPGPRTCDVRSMLCAIPCT